MLESTEVSTTKESTEKQTGCYIYQQSDGRWVSEEATMKIVNKRFKEKGVKTYVHFHRPASECVQEGQDKCGEYPLEV